MGNSGSKTKRRRRYPVRESNRCCNCRNQCKVVCCPPPCCPPPNPCPSQGVISGYAVAYSVC